MKQEISLKDIFAALEAEPDDYKEIAPALSKTFRHLTSDSRDIIDGTVFVAIKGEKFDGHDFLEAAANIKGCLLIVSNPEKISTEKLKNIPAILVKDTRLALSRLAAVFSGQPSKEMKIVAVTGTNGKTTTNWMIYHLMLLLGLPSARFGTLGFEVITADGSISREGNLTTPDAISLQNDLSEARNLGAKAAVMETSSHALDQFRVEDVHFDNVIFTNLTRDHLDYHIDMASYFKAKARLFELLKRSSKKEKRAIINLNSEFGQQMLQFARELELPTWTFGSKEDCDFKIKNFEQNLSGSNLDFEFEGLSYTLKNKFIGFHNAENAVAAILSCLSLGFSLARILSVFAEIPQVPGRLESVGNSGIGIFVDYAHTPDALQNVLQSLKPLVNGDLWVIFGCGGDRDRGKRPQMAKIVSDFTDKIVVTSDNPRTEDPEGIIKDILSEGVKPVITDIDRKSAIKSTIQQAKKGDIILIAGKGHENYQIIGTERLHFSDVEEVEKALATF